MGNASGLLEFQCRDENDDSSDESDATSSDEEGPYLLRKFPSREAVIIFDWDDTLMCSTELKAKRHPSQRTLQLLEAAVESVLRTAMELGKVVIVTNANLCWVRETASQFIPGVLPLLSSIDILSARQSYQDKFPSNRAAWKRQAFRDLIGEKRSTDINLVVLGDSPAEIQAGKSAVRKCGEGDSIVKTVKFKRAPATLELLGELEEVSRCLGTLVAEDKSVSKRLVHGSLSGHWRLRDDGSYMNLNLAIL